MSQIKPKYAPLLLPYSLLGAANGIPQLNASGTIPTSYLPSSVTGGLNFKGSYDATAALPTSPSNGDFYVVSKAGNAGGFATALSVGDYLFYSSSASAWEVVYAPSTTDALSEGTTNQYFTAARALAAAVTSSLSGNSSTQAPTASSVNSALAQKAASFQRIKERWVLSSTDISNGYKIFSHAAVIYSITAGIQGLGLIEESLDSGSTGDYVVSIDSSTTFTKLTWKNDLATGGASPLAVNDVLFVHYSY